MALYDYKCPKCHTVLEDVRHPINDEPVVICPKCMGLMKRQVCSTAFMLKGSGWEKDGYA